MITCTSRLCALFRTQSPHDFFSNEICAAVIVAMKPSQASTPSSTPSVTDFPPKFSASNARTHALSSDATTPTSMPVGPGLPSCACAVPRYAIQRVPKTRGELSHGAAPVVPDPGRTQAAASRAGERDERRNVQCDQLQTKRGEALRQQREKPECERDDVSEEYRPRDRSELGVALIVQGAYVDRQRDEEESEKASRGCHESHVEVVPEDELLRHQRIPSTFRALVRSDALLSGARSRRAWRSSARIARSA